MTLFERWLSLWVALCIVAGIALGAIAPGLAQGIAAMEVARINLPVAVLVWLMIIPMLLRVDFAAMGKVGQQWRGITITLLVNWAVKPFTLFGLGLFFLGWLFIDWLPADQVDSYIAGLILLGAAPCTAMVFVWSQLSSGDAEFTISQVALNDAVMLVAFAPIVALLLGVASIIIPWDTLVLSVVLYILVPVAFAQLLRRRLLGNGGQSALDAILARLQPLSMAALLATLVLLFAFQGEQILAQPLIIALIAVPIIVQTYFIAALAYGLNRVAGSPWQVAGPSCLIGASNFFELAVATAIALFGLGSGAALATVVGVLVEVPVMLTLVALVNRSRSWYEGGMPRG